MEFVKIELTQKQRELVFEYLKDNRKTTAEAWMVASLNEKGEMVVSLCLMKINTPK